MKHAIKSVVLGLSLLLANGSIAYAQDLREAARASLYKGFEAYEMQDYTTALKEWRPLAEQGNSVVQFIFGEMYRQGLGVTKDYKEAMKWFRLAAEKGNADAQTNLGLMYASGDGVVQDYKAQSNLGAMFYAGQGVIQNYLYAHMWSNIAAISGDADSVYNRDVVAKKMTAADISKAQDLASACIQKNFKGC
jgi:TPR repeat protein